MMSAGQTSSRLAWRSRRPAQFCSTRAAASGRSFSSHHFPATRQLVRYSPALRHGSRQLRIHFRSQHETFTRFIATSSASSSPSPGATFPFLTPIALLIQFTTSLALVLLLWNNTFQIMNVCGPSMYPFLNTDYDRTTAGDWVLVDMRKSYSLASFLSRRRQQRQHNFDEGGIPVQRGDVVTFWSPNDPNRMQVKRVIGVGGDLISPKPVARSRTAKSGGKSVEQQFLKDQLPHVQMVPQGHLWVEGDQPEASKNYDSNWYGPISRSLVVGKVIAVVWPWHRRGWISRPREQDDGAQRVIIR